MISEDVSEKSLLSKRDCAEVYLLPVFAEYDLDRDISALENILQHRMYNLLSSFKNSDVVGVKLCESCPEESGRYVHPLLSLLKKKGISGFLCNTSRRHEDYRDNGVVRAYAASDVCDAGECLFPFVSLDGMYGEHEISKRTDGRLDENVYLAGELPNLDGLLSVSCMVASSGKKISSAIVNLGHGLASKRGKIQQMTMSCPRVNIKKCYTCRRCLRECPSNAITIGDGHVVIDSKKCIMCGKCVEIARYGGITYDWDATSVHYNTAVAQHAKGVLAVLDGKVICVNIILCVEDGKTKFVSAMISRDPVALDFAMINFCEEKSIFLQDELDSLREQVMSADAEGVGSVDHKLVVVAY